MTTTAEADDEQKYESVVECMGRERGGYMLKRRVSISPAPLSDGS
jgi:hypothetical protein